MSKLRVAILTSLETGSALEAFSALARHPEVKVAGILFDSERPSVRQRFRNLRRNIKREGIGYIGFRLMEAVREQLNSLANSIVSQAEVGDLLRRSFPDQPRALKDFQSLFGVQVHDVGNLNSPRAVEVLKELDVDLGIILGARVLKRSTFSVPRMGCLNVHKGKVPEYRGMPPGFWELYDNQSSAGVTIHFVDDGLDTGDIICNDTVLIHSCDTVETLQAKLDSLAHRLLIQSVSEVANGTYARMRQPTWLEKARTNPTQAQRRALKSKRPAMRTVPTSPVMNCVKTVLYLVIWYGGLIYLLRAFRRMFGIQRGCVVLYHRVNDQLDDPLTIGVGRFAEHMVAIKRDYAPIDSVTLVQNLRMGTRFPSEAVAIHFDDCYRDVLTNAAPVLKQVGVLASVFVSTGFIGTRRVFPHDVENCPIALDNLNEEDLKALDRQGWVIGSHTVNHKDLGSASDEEARSEVVQSKHDLESVLGKSISMFSYPFGGQRHSRPGIAEIVQEAGYDAMFSAYGGYVHVGDSSYNIRRIGISGHFRTLDLIMEIEGVSIGVIKQKLLDWTGRASINKRDQKSSSQN